MRFVACLLLAAAVLPLGVAPTHGASAGATQADDYRLASAEGIAGLVAEALADEGADPDTIAVELAEPLLAIHLPPDPDARVSVEDVAMDPTGRRFTARIAAPTATGAIQRRVIAGRVYRVASVPVLARPLGRGETISAEDLEWVRLKNSRLGGSTIVDADDLVGFSTRRGLRAGTPIRASQVRKPVVVAKGSLVTLMLTTPGIALSARGRAMEDGGRGEVIRVSNLQSHVIVEGNVIAPGRVEVRPLVRARGG